MKKLPAHQKTPFKDSSFTLDFVGIGAPRSGTTWVAECLSDHPQINLSKEKEVDFFSSQDHFVELFNLRNRWDKGIEYYKTLFPELKTQHKVSGEFSVSYLSDEKAPGRIHEFFPDTKIIVCLRKPQEMITSYYYWLKNSIASQHKMSEPIENLMSTGFIKYALFGESLERYYQLFQKHQIHIVWFEDIKENPAQTIKDLYDFLSVDSSFVPKSINTVINKNMNIKFPLLNKAAGLVYSIPGLNKNSKLFKAFYTVYQHINLKRVNQYKSENSQRFDLNSYFIKDIELLEKLTHKNLTHWK
jgi:hypothetical protein